MELADHHFEPLDSRQPDPRRRSDAPKQGPWRCANCPKEFSQKEYRYKHQQRCLLAKQKLSKQKSCVACAASKLGCDLRVPACSRCLNRNKRCEYVSSTKETNRQSHERRDRERTRSRDVTTTADLPPRLQDVLSSGLVHTTIEKDASGRGARSNTGSEFGVAMGTSNEMDHGATRSSSLVTSGSQRLPRNRPPRPPSSVGLTNWPLDSNEGRQGISDQLLGPAMGTSSREPDWLSRNLYGLGGEDGLPSWQHGGSWASRSPLMSPDQPAPAQLNDNIFGNVVAGSASDDMNFDLLGSLGILTRNRISSTPGAQTTPASSVLHRQPSTTSQRAIKSVEPYRTNEMEDNSPRRQDQQSGMAGATLHEASKTVYEEDFPTSSRLSSIPDADARSRSCPFYRLHTDDDLVRILRGYPRVMTSPGVYPPFVHHKLYRCAAGDVSEPLARAFCCVGAFYASVPTSKTFVYSLINDQSSKLVKGFHQWPGSDTDMLAVVHAMCIYQILGFFVSSSREQARSTELQHMYFLKMTRKLIRQYLQTASGEKGEEVDWRKWIMNETIRRTVFLVNTINTLSCRIQKQDPNYFEPLDDNLVLNMCIPAPQSVWSASSAEEWMAAKAQLRVDESARSRLTLAQVIQQLKGDGLDSDTDMTGYPNRGERLVKYEQLDEFTRLIVFTACMQPQS